MRKRWSCSYKRHVPLIDEGINGIFIGYYHPDVYFMSIELDFLYILSRRIQHEHPLFFISPSLSYTQSPLNDHHTSNLWLLRTTFIDNGGVS